MKRLVCSAALLCSLGALAQEGQYPKHMISLGNDAFGFSAQGEKFDPESSSLVKDLNVSLGNLNLNYAYSITNRFQIGLSVSSSTEKTETKYRDDDEITDETTTSAVGIFGLYNFSDDLHNAFYVGLGIGGGSIKVEHTEKDTPANDTEVKTGYTMTAVNFGKRFSLEKMLNIKNLVYSPSLSGYAATYDKDYKDAGLKKSSGFIIVPIKFDLLF